MVGSFFFFLPFLLFPDVILDEFSESQRSRDEATGSSAVAMLTRSSEASLRGERRRRLNSLRGSDNICRRSGRRAVAAKRRALPLFYLIKCCWGLSVSC